MFLQDKRGIRLPLTEGLGHALCLEFIFFSLVGWVLDCLLVCGAVCLFVFSKIRDGAGSYLGAVPMEIRRSSLRLLYSFGCHWRLPCWQSTAHLQSLPPLRIPAISLIIWISEPQGRFPLNIQKDSGNLLSALSYLWKEARIQSAHNVPPRKIPQSL